MRTICATLLCAVSLASCNRATPTAPSPVVPPPPPVSQVPPTESILSISLIGDQWVFANAAPVQMSARLVTSTTPFEYVIDNERVTWTVEPSGIATVDRQGLVTPVANGTATVRAALGDRVGSNPIRVLPNFAGNWSGEYVVTGCSGGADFRSCPRIMFNESPNRVRYAFRLALAQDRDTLTGTLVEPSPSVGDVVTPVTGFVRLSGALVLEATLAQPNLDPIRITNWTSTFNATATQISGAFTKIVPARHTVGLDNYYTTRTEREFSGVNRAP
jgi:hypothetical protein